LPKNFSRLLLLPLLMLFIVIYLGASFPATQAYAQPAPDSCPEFFPNCSVFPGSSNEGVKSVCPANLQGFPTTANPNISGAENRFIQCERNWANANNAYQPGAAVGNQVADYCELNFTGAYLTSCHKGFNKKGQGTAQAACGNDKACRVGFKVSADREAANNPDQGNNNADADRSPDCDAQLNSPLSWIICPLVDMGTAFTDWVYTEFVRGMLEEVPISTDTNDGGYRAWQSFRILANIILVGAMLILVYGMIRGGR
jgi:hypothetical protein